MRLLILGSSGFLASGIDRYLTIDNRLEIYRHSYSQAGIDIQADFNDGAALKSVIKHVNPDIILNCLGLTSLELCQKNPLLAFRLNARVPEIILQLRQSDRSLDYYVVQISTDNFYDAPLGMSSCETDQVRLLNVYAASKYAAEQMFNDSEDLVLRTNFIGKSFSVDGSKGLADWIFESVCLGENPILAYEDVHFSPLHFEDLANVLIQIFTSRPNGTFNLGSNIGISKYEFARIFVETMGGDISLVTKGRMVEKETGNGLKRPKNMNMKSNKIESALNLYLPCTVDVIAKAAFDYENK